MTFSFLHVGIICIVYISIIFGVAYATENGWISEKVVTHPIVYVFSLGIFASAWSFYGVIDLAQNFGYGALAYYLGTGALFLLSPLTLKPLTELARRYQITSMADLLTFRYHSHSVGGIVTLCMLLAMTPLLALQIKAVGDTIHILTLYSGDNLTSNNSDFGSREMFALAYCIVITFFAVLFGSNRERHKGLITAMAFESLIKLFGLCAVGIFALYYVFDGPADLDLWLTENPENIDRLYSTVNTASFHTMLLVFLSTAISMPHIFHMTVVENKVKDASRLVSWAFPLFLFFMALPIFPILWAGLKLNSQMPAEYFPLAVPIASGNATFTIISFIAGLSAATGAVIAIALSVATMIMNYWILPSTPLRTKKEIYGQLTRIRRILIAVVIVIGYGFYLSLKNRFNLTDLAISAFIATLQFLPGILAVVYWSRGNRRGFIAGLFVGIAIWFSGIFMPMIWGQHNYTITIFDVPVVLGVQSWSALTLWSLALNAITFIVVSHYSSQSHDERYSAELCSEDELSHPIRLTLDVRSPDEMVERLSERIGESTARIEVEKALQSLALNANESRPYALRLLRNEVEANLSGLLGIALASEIVDKQLPFKLPEKEADTDITLMENRISDMRDELTGVAGELNQLRLYHRRTFEELPLAACSVGKDMEVMLWNSALEDLTGIASESVTGSRLAEVLDPWGPLLTDFFSSAKAHFYKQEIELLGKPHWISLHKALVPSSFFQKVDSQVMILEDVTELQILEQELIHSERLASIGRLAAGVAHEIGNPVTGIACLAQNMRYETDNEELLETSEQILSQTDRVSKIVQSLVSFSHSGSHQNSVSDEVNLWQCAQEGINLIALQIERGQMNYQNKIPEPLVIKGDSQRIIQVFVNLLSNARDASPENTDIVIEGEQTPDYVKFSVTDGGSGISDEIKDQILEPFFTTKEPGEGTGLGLAMVYSIIDDHKGSIEIISPVDKVLQKGTKFVVKLPIALESHRI
ncbi:ATP-binding protein [Agarilytica rhodophyticola]|uniref:ATP-binding protein n=1 Tax=Agarilytica rhodophyticola TaxID=1737490 RepID=UPI000B3449D2|nr:ATP-binding protein [Agarilytica rhodophyticola]